MNKFYINVPKGIRFLSKWKDFNFNNFPDRCIIDKQLPGCGFTEYCLSGPDNLILCSPRKKLIKNKFDQHKKDTFLVVRDDESDPIADKDISKERKVNDKVEKVIENNFLEVENRIESFLEKLRQSTKISKQIDEKDLDSNSYKKLYFDLRDYINKMYMLSKPCKILVTYDSYRLVREILINLNIFSNFKTVIDEFQSILHDSRFKSDTEIGFLEYLKQSPTSYFVSATPMLDDYIEMLDEFKGLPYYVLDWKALDPTRIVTPNLRILTMKSTGEKAAEVIQRYLSGNFEKVIVRDKDAGKLREVVSNEAVLFVNSVNHIIAIIKKNKLSPEQVTILCSDTDANKNKIKRKLGKKFLQSVSDIPLRDEKPKMFTFCTRTTYLGADFYSLCARTFIFSDSNIDCLAVDISDDLPQILGRQRLDENPWKNSATIYYRTTCDWRVKGEETFKEELRKKLVRSKNLLNSFDLVNNNSKSLEEILDLAITYENLSKVFNYKMDYIAVNRIKEGNNKFNLVPCFNNLVYVNELRAFRIAQIDYKDRFSVFSGIENKFGAKSIDSNNRKDGAIIMDFLRKYDESNTVGKYKLLCENDLQKETMDYILDQIPDTDPIKSNYIALGPKELKAAAYKKAEIERRKENILFDKDKIAREIFLRFSVGDVVPLVVIKRVLIDIYSKVGYSKSAVGGDLYGYFNIRETAVRRDVDGSGIKKRVKSYELLSPKDEYTSLYNQVKSELK